MQSPWWHLGETRPGLLIVTFISEYPFWRAKVPAGYLDDVGSNRRTDGRVGRRRRQYSGQPYAGSIVEVDEDDGMRYFPEARNRRAVHDDEAVDPAGASDGFKGRRGAAHTAAFERRVHQPSPAVVARADRTPRARCWPQ
jgi:hypothetical protein